MKTQTYGTIDFSLDTHLRFPDTVQTYACTRGDGIANYKEKRLNGEIKLDAPQEELPCDGAGRWIKGEEKSDGYVYGVKESDGDYHYEYRYDSGDEDKKWMEECDRNYLARLYLLGANTAQERRDLAENRELAAKAAEEIDKLPEEQLSVALREFYAYRVRQITYDITPLPNELIAITTSYLTGSDIGKESKAIKSVVTSPSVADDASNVQLQQVKVQSAPSKNTLPSNAAPRVTLAPTSFWSQSLPTSSSQAFSSDSMSTASSSAYSTKFTLGNS